MAFLLSRLLVLRFRSITGFAMAGMFLAASPAGRDPKAHRSPNTVRTATIMLAPVNLAISLREQIEHGAREIVCINAST